MLLVTRLHQLAKQCTTSHQWQAHAHMWNTNRFPLTNRWLHVQSLWNQLYRWVGIATDDSTHSTQWHCCPSLVEDDTCPAIR